MTKKEKGDLFELFTYYLFKHDPRLNNGLQKIWLFNDIPKNVLKELGLPSTDKGIDLLAVINGKYYAIQCKFRQDPNKIISWGELSTFFGLSFGMNNKIAGGFFVTNTRNLCQEVINSKKVTAIYDDFYDSLTSKFFKNITSNKIRYERKYKNKPQIDSVTAACVHFLENRRGYMEMACGTGKTLASYWIAKALYSKMTVVFVPSLQLLSQFYSDWVKQSYAEERNLKYLLIGSDADVEDEIKEKSNGLTLHLDPVEIRKHLDGNVVVICTYQSADKLAEACDKKFKFDLGIFDEAHKTVGQKGKLFSRMLTNDELIINKRLFMTATPKIYVGNNDDIISMDDKKTYGERIYTYNTGQAIEAGLLTDYQILSIYVTNDAILRDIKANLLVKFKKEFDGKQARYLATILVILKKFADGTIKQLLTYHNTIANAKKFAEFLILINELVYNHNIYVASIDGSESMRTRKNTINEFKNSNMGILCSARVLNEGVNIVSVDSVCFVDSRESTIDIVQCIGRCLRLCDQKKLAYVIVPIFIDDIDDDFDKMEYCTVIKILKAMKSTDDGIVEYFQSNDHYAVTKRKIISREYYDNIDVSKEMDIEEWDRDVNSRLWEIVDQWRNKYVLVKQYAEKNGKVPSCKSRVFAVRQLGDWCNTQRKAKRAGKLSDDSVQTLEYINGWYWNLTGQWNNLFTAVAAYAKKYGKVPSPKSKNRLERSLAHWCRTQRDHKKNGKLSKKLANRLSDVRGWYWTDESRFTVIRTFEYMLNILCQWINANGEMPKKGLVHSEENKIYRWCQAQRRNKKRGILSDDRVDLLNNVKGWVWGFDDVWGEMCKVVKIFVEDKGMLPLSTSIDLYEKKMGIWCAYQRARYNAGKLRGDKIFELEQLKNWYWSKPRISGSKTANPKM